MTMRHSPHPESGAAPESRPPGAEPPSGGGWKGQREFRVARKVRESGTVFSFYLEPCDGEPVAEHKPGQFLTFRVSVDPDQKPLVRCYSISRAGIPDNQYRISIRHLRGRAGAEDLSKGVISRHFHDRIEEGSILDVRQPAGKFVLDEGRGRPAVFLAGGIGVTPLLAMAEAEIRRRPDQDIRFFYAVTDGSDTPLLGRLRELAAERPSFRLCVCYSKPAESDRMGEDYHVAGYIDAGLLKRTLPSSDYEYFICGPPPMMDSLTASLMESGIPKESIHLEMFSPKTVKRASLSVRTAGAERDVTFSGAGKTFRWKPQAGSILEQAEANGISLPSGCRAGKCGTCSARLLEGTFDYISKPGFEAKEGCCLVCVAVPTKDMRFA